MDQLQALYDSEINFHITAFYDEVFSWKLGDEVNGYEAQGKARTIKIAVLDLVQRCFARLPSI